MSNAKFGIDEMDYKPGQMTTTNGHTFQADQWGVLQPKATNQAYIARRNRKMREKMAAGIL